MLWRSIVKQGGTSTHKSSHFTTTNHPRHQVGAERAVAAARRRPAAHRRHAGTTQRRSSASYYSYTSRATVPQLLPCCRYDTATAAAGGACQAWKMLGDYKPMIWRAKMYRTFPQIPTFTKVLFSPFFKKIPHKNIAFGVYFREVK